MIFCLLCTFDTTNDWMNEWINCTGETGTPWRRRQVPLHGQHVTSPQQGRLPARQRSPRSRWFLLSFIRCSGIRGPLSWNKIAISMLNMIYVSVEPRCIEMGLKFGRALIGRQTLPSQKLRRAVMSWHRCDAEATCKNMHRSTSYMSCGCRAPHVTLSVCLSVM